ncbi:MAG: hypothetical protein EBT68_01965 [Verrucomicrobia bacterium]|nr:hypothetical protein [Verrucomicrobiota bacterium]
MREVPGSGEGKEGLRSGRHGGGCFWPVALGILIADQASKIWAEQALQVGASVTMIPGFFSLTRVHNTGVAFGMAQRESCFLRAGWRGHGTGAGGLFRWSRRWWGPERWEI